MNWDDTTLSNIQNLRDQIANYNLFAKSKYDHDWDGWNQNRVLRAATYPKPLPPLPEPILFTKVLKDADLAAEIFVAWATIESANAMNGQPYIPGQEQPDYSPAVEFVRYVRPAPPVIVTPDPDQPSNPLGTPMDENEPVIAFGLAPGDKNPKGFVYTDEEGNKYIKIIRTGFGGRKEQRYNLLDENGNPVDPSK